MSVKYIQDSNKRQLLINMKYIAQKLFQTSTQFIGLNIN